MILIPVSLAEMKDLLGCRPSVWLNGEGRWCNAAADECRGGFEWGMRKRRLPCKVMRL